LGGQEGKLNHKTAWRLRFTYRQHATGAIPVFRSHQQSDFMKHTAKQITTLLTVSMLTAWTVSAQDSPAPSAGMPSGHIHCGTSNIAKTAVLGVVAERIHEDLRYQLPVIKPGVGLIIRQLMHDGPAAQAKMAVRDILLKWNDQWLVHPAQLQVLVESSKPGDQVDMEYLHMGILTKTRITLAEKTGPAGHGRRHHAMDWQNHAPDAAGLAALLGSSKVLKEAARAVAKSGIHSNAMTDILKGIDSNTIADILKGVDSNAIAGILKNMDPPKVAPAPAGGGKIVIIAPDGTRKEINIAEAMKPDDNIRDVLKALDFGKSDPLTWLNSKILWIRPDGTQHEIKLGDILKSRDPLNELLKGLAAPESR
jgi:hypothetical protein